MKKPRRIIVGPFTWIRTKDDGDECWDLKDAVILIGCTWWCKNYGEPAYEGSPFSGWRCGSGGPFQGTYSSREDAMNRVIPYLIRRIKERIRETQKELARREAILGKYGFSTNSK